MQIGLFGGSFTQYADLFTIFRFFSLASVNNAPTHSAEKNDSILGIFWFFVVYRVKKDRIWIFITFTIRILQQQL